MNRINQPKRYSHFGLLLLVAIGSLAVLLLAAACSPQTPPAEATTVATPPAGVQLVPSDTAPAQTPLTVTFDVTATYLITASLPVTAGIGGTETKQGSVPISVDSSSTLTFSTSITPAHAASISAPPPADQSELRVQLSAAIPFSMAGGQPVTFTFDLTSAYQFTAFVGPPNVALLSSPTLTATTVASMTGGITGTQAVTATPSGSATRLARATDAATAATTAAPTRTPRSPAARTPTRTPTRTPQPAATATATQTPTPAPTSTPTAGSTPAPSPTKGATATPGPNRLYIRSQNGSAQGSDYVVVGEVMNGADAPAYFVKVIGTFYGDDGRLVGAQEAPTILPLTVPGQRNPFKMQVSNVAGAVARAEFDLAWSDLTVIGYERLSVLSQKAESEDGLKISGELRNDNGVELTDIVVVVTFYDEEGEILNAFSGTATPTSLSPGQTGVYTIDIAQEIDYASFGVQAQGSSGVR